ncbi:MAG: 5'-nucleotidase C-terminal domain-containing protein [Gemmatimonadota bacterium]
MSCSRLSLVALLLLATSCADQPDALPLESESRPHLAISDGATGGRTGFYFSQPIAPSNRQFAGTFDGSLLAVLTVQVCPVAADGACTAPGQLFTAASIPAVTVDAVGQKYAVNWTAPAAGNYRIIVRSGATQLGFVDVTRTAKGAYTATLPGGYSVTVKGSVLPIRFRIETGIVASVSVTRVTLNGLNPPIVVGGAPATYSATVIDLGGNAIPGAVVTWSGSSDATATVAGSVIGGVATGTVTGVAEGDVFITAASGGATATAPILSVMGDLNEILGISIVPVLRSDACGRFDGRSCESLVGNVVTDAMRAVTGATFALTNAGGLRSALTCPAVDAPSDFCPQNTPPFFQITRGQANAVLPFGNRIVTFMASGTELKAMLENAVSTMPSAAGKFAQVSGLCFTYDVTRAAGDRVVSAVQQAPDATCTGAPIAFAPAAGYLVAVNDFMSTGGDDYAAVAASRVTVGAPLDRVVSSYVRTLGSIAPTIEGRIVCTTSGAVSCPVPAP